VVGSKGRAMRLQQRWVGSQGNVVGRGEERGAALLLELCCHSQLVNVGRTTGADHQGDDEEWV
jgi:hypothetical protein